MIPILDRWFGKTRRFRPGIYWRGLRVTRPMDRVNVGRGHYLLICPESVLHKSHDIGFLHWETPVTFWIWSGRKITRMNFDGFEGAIVAEAQKAPTPPVVPETTWGDVRPYRSGPVLGRYNGLRGGLAH